MVTCAKGMQENCRQNDLVTLCSGSLCFALFRAHQCSILITDRAQIMAAGPRAYFYGSASSNFTGFGSEAMTPESSSLSSPIWRVSYPSIPAVDIKCTKSPFLKASSILAVTLWLLNAS